jgi:cytochrome c peroxidase
VTGRNTPAAVNAVFNVRNFWDGRANRRFNGRNPFGDSDPNARVLRINDLGELEKVRVSIDRASLASQAVGPPLSDVEMSAGGRTWLKLGRKMLSLRPLAQQGVHPNDSVLGPWAISGGKGLTTSYAAMIRAAFQSLWWKSSALVDANLNVVGHRSGDGGHDGEDDGEDDEYDDRSRSTDQYTVMEANFSLFWGLAILAYESTLVSDDAPYDRFADGNASALSPEQRLGLQVFMGASTGNCIACHAGAEFTGASFSARLDDSTRDGMIERMVMGDHQVGIYDGGFYNIGVRPTANDVGLGANDPFGLPLSLARQEQLHPGSVQDNLIGPVATADRIVANGAFKVPSLRNVELTGPYFHNGSIAALRDVVRFYARGGNFHDENIADLDPDIHRVTGLIGHPMRQLALVDFLGSLTDERVRWERAPFDHPALVIPVGASGNEVSVLADLTVAGEARDATRSLPAVGAGGASAPVQSFLNVPLFDPAPIAAPQPVFSALALFASDTLVVRSSPNASGDLWANGAIRLGGAGDLALTGDVVAGGDVSVSGDSTTIAGCLLAHGHVTATASAALATSLIGERIEHFAPLAMPAVPPASGGATNVTVPTGATKTLAPGAWGTVTLKKGAVLVLGPGTYVFRSLTLGSSATVRDDVGGAAGSPDPNDEMSLVPTEKTFVHVLGDLRLGSRAVISPGSADRSSRLKVYAHDGSRAVTLDVGAVFHGSLIAPASAVTVGAGSSLAGAIYARRIELADGVSFQPHPQPGPPLAATAPAASMVAGPSDGLALAPGVADAPGGLAFALLQNQPNPVRSRDVTVIRFALPEARDVSLDVFDVTGRRVTTLAQGRLEPGLHTLAWRGTSNTGVHLPSGVYLYRLAAGTDHAERKLILVD